MTVRSTFLGTSAANAYPEAFCRCVNCERARVLGGPSLRKRSALLVNDDLLIDLGFFNDTATPEIYPLSLHDALPISTSTTIARESRPTSCFNTWPASSPP